MVEVDRMDEGQLERFWGEYDPQTEAPDSLLTYRYVGVAGVVVDRLHAEGSMRMRADLWGPAGPRAAPLSILYAEVLGLLTNAMAAPAPTQFDLTLLDDFAGVETVRCLGEVVHEGRTAIFGKARFVDGDEPERALAVCRDSEAVLGPARRSIDDPPKPIPRQPEMGTWPLLWQAFGAADDQGELSYPTFGSRLGAATGAVHHGPTHVLLEEAAIRAASAGLPSGARLRMRHWHLTLNARAKEAPFRAVASVAGRSATSVAVDTDLTDGGSGRVVASATATFDIVP